MIGLDTNLLVYGEAVDGGDRRGRAKAVIEAALSKGATIPAQVLAELYRVLLRKGRLPASEARRRVNRYRDNAVIAPTLETTLSDAINLATEHRLQVFDAIILTASAEAGVRLLLSEDMQDGFVWRGVTVANPFAQTSHPMIVDLMRSVEERP